MNTTKTFETDRFAETKEIWNGVKKCLDLDENEGKVEIKRITPNHIQVFKSEALWLGGQNPFEKRYFGTELITEFKANAIGNKMVWSNK